MSSVGAGCSFIGETAVLFPAAIKYLSSSLEAGVWGWRFRRHRVHPYHRGAQQQQALELRAHVPLHPPGAQATHWGGWEGCAHPKGHSNPSQVATNREPISQMPVALGNIHSNHRACQPCFIDEETETEDWFGQRLTQFEIKDHTPVILALRR